MRSDRTIRPISPSCVAELSKRLNYVIGRAHSYKARRVDHRAKACQVTDDSTPRIIPSFRVIATTMSTFFSLRTLKAIAAAPLIMPKPHTTLVPLATFGTYGPADGPKDPQKKPHKEKLTSKNEESAAGGASVCCQMRMLILR